MPLPRANWSDAMRSASEGEFNMLPDFFEVSPNEKKDHPNCVASIFSTKREASASKVAILSSRTSIVAKSSSLAAEQRQ